MLLKTFLLKTSVARRAVYVPGHAAVGSEHRPRHDAAARRALGEGRDGDGRHRDGEEGTAQYHQYFMVTEGLHKGMEKSRHYTASCMFFDAGWVFHVFHGVHVVHGIHFVHVLHVHQYCGFR